MTARLAVQPSMDLAALFARNRALYGDLRMEDPPPPNPTPPDRTYDEAHVQRVAAQQKAEGERAATAKIAEQLGMTPEEAKTKLDAATAAERAAMDEATRKQAEAADAKAVADKATADAARETTTAKVTQALLVAGVDLGGQAAKDEERAEKLAMAARLVTVDPGADDAAIKAAVDRVKATVPQLFTATPPAAGGSDPGAGPAGRQQPAGAFGKGGDDEFAKRFPQTATA